MSFAEGTPTVDITLGGKGYTLGYTWGAKRRARDKLQQEGRDANTIHEEDYLSTLLWACLDEASRKELSVEDVEDLIHPDNELDISQKLKMLIKRSEPEPDPNVQPAAAKEPTAGISQSKNSGQLVSTT